MDVRTPQALTRVRPSTILASTRRIVAVERRGDIDFRIQGLPHSAVQEYDHIRKKAVQKLIHQFETDTNEDSVASRLEAKSRVQSIQ